MNPANPNECLVVVDGYNLYYYWSDYIFRNRATLKKWDNSILREKYRSELGEWLWYDLFKLVENLVSRKVGETSEIGQLYYCSAEYSGSDQNARSSRKIQDAFVQYHLNEYNNGREGKDEKFVKEYGYFSDGNGKPPEEKQTDINIALACVERSLLTAPHYRNVIIISADNDFAPVIKLLKAHNRRAWQIKPEHKAIGVEYLKRANFSKYISPKILSPIPKKKNNRQTTQGKGW